MPQVIDDVVDPTERRDRHMPRPAAPRGRPLVIVLAIAVATAASLAPARGAQDRDDEPVIDSALIEEALEIVAEEFVDGEAIDREALTRGALRGLVEALGDDGHTVYLTPEELEAERDALEGRVTGIGVLVDRRAGQPVVISVVDGSPADLAGLRSGDLLVSIDGHEVARLPESDLGALVRGEPGTTVRLEVDRPGSAEPFEITIVRQELEVPPVTWAPVPGSRAAVIRIVQFSSDAGTQTVEAVEHALEGGAEALVIDLRGNPGGLVDEAVEVVGAFIEEGVAYRQRDRQDRIRDVPVRGRAVGADVPLVVLVDYGTASAAEIVAAALRDNDRARIIGEPTFGTGTILNTFTLTDGSALRIGVLEWLTPDGDLVFRVGLTPDEHVELEEGAAALEPSDLLGMSASDVGASGDRPLRRALDILDG
jgi:carboxyl-terminal processing protease